ncbi:hypothetical protein [Desertivibrio insolitus]|uniref:hypothetical protein n=1 Tax=Herbiconiux sp. SYSU D00978 TaxID=2812562 RepID=UPI001A96FD08|nr:hypothetical protein [Herbiconiux sp. SYSU D00978]
MITNWYRTILGIFAAVALLSAAALFIAVYAGNNASLLTSAFVVLWLGLGVGSVWYLIAAITRSTEASARAVIRAIRQEGAKTRRETYTTGAIDTATGSTGSMTGVTSTATARPAGAAGATAAPTGITGTTDAAQTATGAGATPGAGSATGSTGTSRR